ncbi:MAG: hypothetical protein U0359_01975 [Byssovorax sp.]
MGEERAHGDREDAESAAEAREDGTRRAPVAPDLLGELKEGRAPPTVVAALIAWAITVAPVGLGRGMSALSAIPAVLALVAGVAGPLVRARRPKIGRHLGISVFLGLSVLVWMANSGSIHPLRLEPVRGLFGAVAWGIFALSWSERWSFTPEPVAPDPDAPLLLARSTLPAGAVPTAVLGVIAAVVYLVLAFRAREPERALMAQAVALACAIGMVSAGATVAVARGKVRSTAGRRVSSQAVRALLLLVTFGLGGALILVMR